MVAGRAFCSEYLQSVVMVDFVGTSIGLGGRVTGADLLNAVLEEGASESSFEYGCGVNWFVLFR